MLSNDEVGQLLLAPPADETTGLRDRAILETIYSAGLRVSELVALRDGDLDAHEQIIRVRGKGRKERISPLGSYALKAINQYARRRIRDPKTENLGRDAPVFVNRFGRILTTRSVGRMLEKYIAVVGLDTSNQPPHAASQLCNTFIRPGCGHPQRARITWSQEPGDDTDLHAR